MKRNLEVKNNVDDMIYQVLNYIDISNLPVDEAETLVYEILSSIIMWNCDWDPEHIDMKSIIPQVNEMLLRLQLQLPQKLEECVKNNGYRETGE